jgi:glucose uptake protein GlcU
LAAMQQILGMVTGALLTASIVFMWYDDVNM